ncbi:MAG TPA: cytochrome c, partial [Stellaceae bacterium]|nr:cytochrome c [Stellaceae bacterium]
KQLPAADLAALATYVVSLAPPRPAAEVKAAREAAERAAWQPATALAAAEAGPAATGAQIFAGACASCHSAGEGQPFYRPVELGLSSVVNAPGPRNFINIVVDGIAPPPGAHGRSMPPFGTALSDPQITLLAQYVRGHFSAKPPWTEIGESLLAARQGKGP